MQNIIALLMVILIFPITGVAQSFGKNTVKEDEHEFFLALKNAAALDALDTEFSMAMTLNYDGVIQVNASPLNDKPWDPDPQSCWPKAGLWESRSVAPDLRLNLLRQFQTEKREMVEQKIHRWHGEFSRDGSIEKFYWKQWPAYWREFYQAQWAGLRPVAMVEMQVKTHGTSDHLLMDVSFQARGNQAVLLHFPSYVRTAFEMPGHDIEYVEKPLKEITLAAGGPAFKLTLRASPIQKMKVSAPSKKSKHKQVLKRKALLRYRNNFSLKWPRNAANPALPRHLKLNICRAVQYRP